jgi:hypothetical protein
MLNRKTQLTQNQISSNKLAESTSNLQHGLLLLHIPPESLTHITSNLDPKSLLALAQVRNCLFKTDATRLLNRFVVYRSIPVYLIT